MFFSLLNASIFNNWDLTLVFHLFLVIASILNFILLSVWRKSHLHRRFWSQYIVLWNFNSIDRYQVVRVVVVCDCIGSCLEHLYWIWILDMAYSSGISNILLILMIHDVVYKVCILQEVLELSAYNWLSYHWPSQRSLGVVGIILLYSESATSLLIRKFQIIYYRIII